MNKTVFSVELFFSLIAVTVQETATDPARFGSKKGNIALLFNQSAYNKQ
ncbi:hypothetical protein [Flavobacterium sp. RSP15]|nr:hypothetical protein [Flavobacterium sp. RSP15]